jgi:hypothetical protein
MVLLTRAVADEAERRRQRAWPDCGWVDGKQFNRASLIVVGSVVRVKRGFSAAMGCYARLSSDLRAGALGGRAQSGGRRRERARRRVQASADGGGYQATRWSN